MPNQELASLQAHKDLTTKFSGLALDSKLSGTTVTIVVYLREQSRLVVAHVGNNRAVLCKLGKGGMPTRKAQICTCGIRWT